MWASINWSNVAGNALVAFYVTCLVAVALYGFHRYVLLYLYRKYKHNTYTPLADFLPDRLPRITIQLPMYNEDLVAERVINATCQIDYPLDKLEIQVLDDSTDHSADIAKAAVEEWSAKGYPIKYIHRDNRVGYKAGALAEGLKQSSGEYIAIFDADFIPPKDLLRNVVHYFTDDKVGMVQVRWDHLNRDASILTRSQAIFLDGHFVIEHTARNRSGRFMHFNGTAGVWRRACIDDGGGWEHDTLTEDLDLSYRCQMKGWQFVYLPQFCAPAELPPEMIAFKQQAHRWTKGSFQTAIKLLPKVLKSKHLSYRIKTEAFFHLTNTVVYPLMVLLTVLMFPTFFNNLSPFQGKSWSQYLFSATLFVMATCSSGMFFVWGQRELLGKEATWKSIVYIPVLMALGVGICLNNTKAFFEAIWGAIRKKPSEFVRTPKYGVTGKTRQSWGRSPPGPSTAPVDPPRDATDAVEPASTAAVPQPPRYFTFKRLALPIIEIAFGCYMACCIYISVAMYLWWGEKWSLASVPFLLIFASGYFYVGMGSVYALWHMQVEAQEEYEEALEIAGGV
jgi:cellulose synthase/poly-beta-1,6-N-acetylglucosamine synthase-like glycosyltransferase